MRTAARPGLSRPIGVPRPRDCIRRRPPRQRHDGAAAVYLSRASPVGNAGARALVQPMTEQDPLFERLSSDPDVCGGQVCVRGTRIPVALILDALAGGDTVEDLLRGYPTLAREDVAAALAYGALLARKQILPLIPAS